MIKGKKEILFFIIGVFACINVHGQDSTASVTYTLQQCVDIAIKNNPTVKQAEFQMESNKVYVQQAWGSMLPGISGSVSRSFYNGKSINPYTNAYVNQGYSADNYNLNANLVLWKGFSYLNNLRANELAYKASQMDWQQARDQFTINVILDYLAVLNDQEQLKMVGRQIDVNKEQVNRLNIQNQEGAIAPSELYKMRGQLGSSELQELTTRNALAIAKLALSQLMNIPYSPNFQLAPIEENTLAEYSITAGEIYQHALNSLAIVKAADLHEQSAKMGIKATRGAYYPTLSISGGLSTNYSSAATSSELIGTTDQASNNYVLINSVKSPVYGPVASYHTAKVAYSNQWSNNFNTGLSLNLQIPILNGLRARSQVKLAKIQEEQAAFQQQTVRKQLRQAIEQDYLNMTTAYETYKKLLLQVQDYTETFREASVKFEAGSISSVDFVIAQNDLNQANLSLIAAKYNYLLQTRILDYYQGKL